MRFNHQVVWWSLMSYHKNPQDQAVKHQFLSIWDATWVPLDASCTFLYIFFPFCPKSPEEWSPSKCRWGTNATPQSPSATPQRQKMISTSQMMFKTSTELQGEISNFGGFVGWFFPYHHFYRTKTYKKHEEPSPQYQFSMPKSARLDLEGLSKHTKQEGTKGTPPFSSLPWSSAWRTRAWNHQCGQVVDLLVFDIYFWFLNKHSSLGEKQLEYAWTVGVDLWSLGWPSGVSWSFIGDIWGVESVTCRPTATLMMGPLRPTWTNWSTRM